MPTLFISLAVSLVLFVVITDAVEAKTPSSADLKVLSFNLRFANPKDEGNLWEDRREIVYDLFRAEQPDVVGFQEALRTQLDDLRRALPEYAEYGVGRADGRSEGEHATILYRKDRFQRRDGGTFWLSETPETPGSKSWGNRVVRICTWIRLREKASGRSFYVFNVHLDHESQPSREKSIQLILKRIRERKHPNPVLLTGDFNAG